MRRYFRSNVPTLGAIAACIAALAIVAAPVAGSAAPKAAAPKVSETTASARKSNVLRIERFTLDNGMRVVVQPDSSAPMVAIGLMVDVGARDELKGKSGLAHFFEHMMFQGSAKVGKMEHFSALEAVGARLNANTSIDRTYYYEVVPRGAVDLALWLESERFASLKINKANVENQRQTVMEERRQNYGNRPYAESRLKLRKMAFTTWELSHSTIGSMADLQGAPLEAFEAFWRHYYTPNNVVLALVGDITLDDAKRLAEKHMGKLERRAEIKKARFAEPQQAVHVYDTYAERLGKMPAFHLAWRIPARPHPDSYAIEVLSELLDGGDAARLRKKLSKDTGLATRHFAGIYGQRDVDLFHIFAELSQPGAKALDKAKKITRETIYKIGRDGVSAAELQRAKVSFEASYVFGLESFSRRAAALCRHELYYGDANGFNRVLDKYRAVTVDDIVRVTRKYFTFDREVELDVLPKGMAAIKGAGAKPKYVAKAEKALAKKLERQRKSEEKRLKREQLRAKRAAAKAAKAEARRAKREAKKKAREETKRKRAEARAAKKADKAVKAAAAKDAAAKAAAAKKAAAAQKAAKSAKSAKPAPAAKPEAPKPAAADAPEKAEK